ncbi:HK97 gp10 family phage protein [Enterococcus faecalis EnGen0101]|uniref:HK97-gp10 family putative phage morphogenesis protein n=1 Tax=Enterococcus faecalis TaxID=1351 RepID=UPI000330DBA6|nr:HK97-gp10 family putative phage morphogenesis protein [Enterococcus faecalis]EOF36588.1 HK97 gp10 family phage protein [Enterococcus faecalis EnGen0101]
MSNNGFLDMANHLGTIAEVTEEITKESLEEAANFYLNKLLPKVPKSLLKKKHMQDQLKVEVTNEGVEVVFEDTAFYWRFAENGTVNQKAQHFASGTFEQYKSQIEMIMTKKIMNKMKG